MVKNQINTGVASTSLDSICSYPRALRDLVTISAAPATSRATPAVAAAVAPAVTVISKKRPRHHTPETTHRAKHHPVMQLWNYEYYREEI